MADRAGYPYPQSDFADGQLALSDPVHGSERDLGSLSGLQSGPQSGGSGGAVGPDQSTVAQFQSGAASGAWRLAQVDRDHGGGLCAFGQDAVAGLAQAARGQ